MAALRVMARGRPSSGEGERGKGVLRTFLPRSERGSKPARSGPGEEVVLAHGESGSEKVRSLTLLSADIQRRNVVGLVGLTLGWRRGALDTPSTSESALTMLRLSVNVHLNARGRKVDYARSFCFALGREVGVSRSAGLSQRTVDAVAGIEGLRGFEDEPPRLAVAPAPEATAPASERDTFPRDTMRRDTREHERPMVAEVVDLSEGETRPTTAAPTARTTRVEPQTVADAAASAAPARDEAPTGPGWYPDPGRHAELRFWDGHRWTAHVSGDGRMWLSPLGPRDGRS